MTGNDHLAYLAMRRRARVLTAIACVVCLVVAFFALAASSRRRWIAGASLAEMETAYKDNSQDEDIAFAYVCRLIDDDRCDVAKPVLERLVRRRPTEANYWFTLGRINDAISRPDLAYAAYRECTRRDPHYARSHVGMGAILASSGLLTDALREFERARQIDPAAPMDYKSLVRCLIAKGRLQEAWDQQHASVFRNPGDEYAFVALTDLGVRLGKADLEPLLRKRIHAFPQYPSSVVRGMLIRLLLSRSHSPRTLSEIGHIAAGGFGPGGDRPDFYIEYSAALVLEGKLARARILLSRALRISPLHERGLELFARVEQLTGNAVHTAQLRRRLAEVRHQNPSILSLRRALTVAPQDTATRLRLAAAYADAGWPGEAAEQCHEILRLRPGDPMASKLLDEYRADAIRRLTQREAAASQAATSQ